MFGLKYFFQNKNDEKMSNETRIDKVAMKSESKNSLSNKINEILHNPPDTWKPYLAKGDYSGIVTMEFNEFITAERGNNKEQAKYEAHHLLAATAQYIQH